ncbi:MAG: hypothetical protein IJX19_07305, partial [Clostridia bacterium]|nr:hypothetical protein [Clostridia bacterium]
AYAGQTFSGLAGGRIIRMDWEKWKAPTPTLPTMCQMSIPCDLTLEKMEGIYYLAANPIPELEQLFLRRERYENVAVAEASAAGFALEAKPYHMALHASEIAEDTKLIVSVFGRDLCLDFSQNEGSFADWKFPISFTKRGLDLVMVIDCLGVEFYLDGGKIYACIMLEDAVPDYNLPTLKITANRACTLDRVELHPLDSIWKQS